MFAIPIKLLLFCLISGALSAQPQQIPAKALVRDVLADAVGWLLANRRVDLKASEVKMRIAFGTHLMVAYDQNSSISVELKADAAGLPVIERVDFGIFNSFDQIANNLLGMECNGSSQDLGHVFRHEGLVTIKAEYSTQRTEAIRSFDSCQAKIWQGLESVIVSAQVIDKWKRCFRAKTSSGDFRMHKAIAGYLGKETPVPKYSIGRHCADAILVPVLIKSDDSWVIWLRPHGQVAGGEVHWNFYYSQTLSSFKHQWKFDLIFPGM
jgi:hypothetical protein